MRSHDAWRDTIKVCKYFTEHPRPHLYIRELPIDVHIQIHRRKQGFTQIITR
ncbi:DUF3322 domain-containing protein [uncultured Bacteroides sp.]|uniref:DUF3322 domain-containing protein n=1 Tax=uncultured Bacteroides sp. TaxID=162156 RepID=UPI0032E91152